MSKIRDNSALRKTIRTAGIARNKTDSVAEATILSMIFAYVTDAAKSVFDSSEGKNGKYAVKATDFDAAIFSLLCGPGVGQSLVRFACQTIRDIVAGKGSALQQYVVKHAKRTRGGVAVFTIGRIAPLWGQFTKKAGSDILKVKGKILEILIPAGADKNAEAEWRNWDTVSNALIEAAFTKKGQAAKPTDRTASESVAFVVGKGGPLLRAIEALNGKRSKRAKELAAALADVLARFGADAPAEKAAKKAKRKMNSAAKRQNRARQTGEARNPEKGRINADAETVEAAAKVS